jgi:lactoylglutathione lyase
MIEIRGLFESHLTVANLERSVRFYQDVLKLPLARIFPERRVAFFWIGSSGKAMLGLWETGSGPQRINLHIAFLATLEDVLAAPEQLRKVGITPLDFDDQPTSEPVVLAWMPAAAVYLRDPDGNLLEFLAMLPQEPKQELGVVPWSKWTSKAPAI